MRRLGKPADFVSGILLVVFAGAIMWIGRDLQVGTAARMGPGYVPRLLAYVIGAFGLVIALRAIRQQGSPKGRVPVWPQAVIAASVLLFAMTIETAGLAIAATLTVVVAGAVAQDRRWHEIALLAVALAAFSVLAFPIGLGVSMRIWPW